MKGEKNIFFIYQINFAQPEKFLNFVKKGHFKMALSDKVQNMKFMQKGNNPTGAADAKKIEKNRVQDSSEWSSARSKSLKVLKTKKTKVRSVGYSSISAVGPVNVVDSAAGRRKFGEEPKISKKSDKSDKSDKSKKEPPITQKTKSLAALWKANMKN